MGRRAPILTIVVLLLGMHGRALGADANPEWEPVIAATKKEGKVVIGAPPGSDFRTEVQAKLKKRFDLNSALLEFHRRSRPYKLRALL